MAKTKVIKISDLIEVLAKEFEKGNTSITLYGYIADESNTNNLIVSDKEAFSEQSFADWQLERNGF
jgi:hypothetical protein